MQKDVLWLWCALEPMLPTSVSADGVVKMSDSEGLVSETAVISVYNFCSKCVCGEPVWESAHTHNDA